jgi:hypothetical protein
LFLYPPPATRAAEDLPCTLGILHPSDLLLYCQMYLCTVLCRVLCSMLLCYLSYGDARQGRLRDQAISHGGSALFAFVRDWFYAVLSDPGDRRSVLSLGAFASFSLHHFLSVGYQTARAWHGTATRWVPPSSVIQYKYRSILFATTVPVPAVFVLFNSVSRGFQRYPLFGTCSRPDQGMGFLDQIRGTWFSGRCGPQKPDFNRYDILVARRGVCRNHTPGCIIIPLLSRSV